MVVGLVEDTQYNNKYGVIKRLPFGNNDYIIELDSGARISIDPKNLAAVKSDE